MRDEKLLILAALAWLVWYMIAMKLARELDATQTALNAVNRDNRILAILATGHLRERDSE